MTKQRSGTKVFAILCRTEASEGTVIAVCASESEAQAYLLSLGYERHEPTDGQWSPWYERQTELGVCELAMVKLVQWLGQPMLMFEWDAPPETAVCRGLLSLSIKCPDEDACDG